MFWGDWAVKSRGPLYLYWLLVVVTLVWPMPLELFRIKASLPVLSFNCLDSFYWAI
jgi:uncharacterized membrane protein